MIVTHPTAGCMRVHCTSRFSALDESLDSLVEGIFLVPEVLAVVVEPKHSRAEITYTRLNGASDNAVGRIVEALEQAPSPAGDRREAIARCREICIGEGLPLRVFKQGDLLSTWEIKHQLPGRIRLHHAALSRKEVREAVVSALRKEAGVESCDVNSFASTVAVQYDAHRLDRERLFQLLDRAAANGTKPVPNGLAAIPESDSPPLETPSGKSPAGARDWNAALGKMELDAPQSADREFTVNSASLALAAAGQFVAPVFLPAGAFLLLAGAYPGIREAYRQAVEKKHLGTEVLQTVFLSCCLATGEIFAGALMTWCGSLGRKLMAKTQAESRKLLADNPEERISTVRVIREGSEVVIPAGALARGEIFVVESGEAVAADGFISDGFGIVDQHVLTGDGSPVKKAAGDRVFASTTVIAGKLFVLADKVGEETACAVVNRMIAEVLEQNPGERSPAAVLADRAVVPTLALGALAAGTVGFGGAMAVMTCDLGTGILGAEPIGVQTSLSVCAHRGMLIKDRCALEILNGVDTVLIDRSALTAGGDWHVARVFGCRGWDAPRLLQVAAAVEGRFAHPIARAIARKLLALRLVVPRAETARFHVGLGVAGEVDGRSVRVGSARFMEKEGVAVPAELRLQVERSLGEGRNPVLVAVDGLVTGCIELRPSSRSGLDGFVEGLRRRGIQHVAILSSGSDPATRTMAVAAGVDRYFSGVLPGNEARCVEMLQSEGRKVCFAGDGPLDPGVIRRADLAVSLGGPAGVEADPAQVVFLHRNIGGLCDLIDTARELDDTMRRSWKLIVIPNALCAAGVFTLGFGLWHAVIVNTVTTMLSALNGIVPMRRLAEARADGAVEREMSLVRAMRGEGSR